MSNLSLYTLSTELEAMQHKLAEDGLPPEAITDTIESLALPLEDKATAVVSIARNFEALAAQIREAERQMAARRQMLEKRAESIREYVKECLERAGIHKVTGPHLELAIRKCPPSVDIFDPDQLPDEYLVLPEPPPARPDKQRIAADLKLGRDVPGCRLQQGTTLLIR